MAISNDFLKELIDNTKKGKYSWRPYASQPLRLYELESRQHFVPQKSYILESENKRLVLTTLEARNLRYNTIVEDVVLYSFTDSKSELSLVHSLVNSSGLYMLRKIIELSLVQKEIDANLNFEDLSK